MTRRALIVASLPLLAVASCFAKARLDAAALAHAGYTPERGSPEDYFSARAVGGLTPAEVARRMPPPAEVERYIAPRAGGRDSELLERYIYRYGPGSFPVYVYYRRGGGVIDVYTSDVPGMAEARHVSAAEAERWRLWPQLVRDTSSAAAGPAVVREERTVRVGATPEVWALVWRRRPAPMCGPEDMARALTCPCEGFAYGEQGELDLVRRAPSRTEERFALTPLFHDEESATQPEGLAALQRWPVLGTDYDGADSREIGAEVRARPVVRAMTFGDYDHDGRATEFLLQVGTGACGSRAAVLVGVSTAQPSLHAFTSVAHPEQPLVLHPAIWALLLRGSREVSGVERSCGDHGAETRTEVTLRVGAAGIDGTRAEYECAAGGARGKLVRSERI